jgi:hypothetical protein
MSNSPAQSRAAFKVFVVRMNSGFGLFGLDCIKTRQCSTRLDGCHIASFGDDPCGRIPVFGNPIVNER